MMHFGGINPGFDTLIATSHLETNEPFIMFIEDNDTSVTSTALKEKWSLTLPRAKQLNLQLNQWCLVFIIYRMIPTTKSKCIRVGAHKAVKLIRAAVVNSNQIVEPIVVVKANVQQIIIADVENPYSKKSKSSKDKFQ
ncbi:hypothetical protein ROZALSC1DRAFT_31353 [Rozella allomycis CSF55]|uniref:Uncharacterized protein n=1 Tax=Rozella allomycis (strain CSF55) TaxID=988480 RepID=A0A4P9YBX7_ROZAC|nr:hypothetical protein ROZALSC1DRAFT_31353 [Rozella allomycis CSF55]